MCGRFTLTSPPQAVARAFALDEIAELAPRYNIAPSQEAGVIRAVPESGRRVLELRRWGLVPPWAKDPRLGNRMINARAETVTEKPAYRSAFRSRRCIVPADGFYEWAAGQPRKQPYYIRCGDGAPFGIAGLFEHWRGPGGEVVDSFTLLTTEANDRLRAIHQRMPVILDPKHYERWLDPKLRESESLEPLLSPCPAEWIDLRPVGLHVNDPKHDDPRCVEPLPDATREHEPA